MYCKKCGKQISDGAKFCPYCGTKTDIPIPKNTDFETKNTDFEQKVTPVQKTLDLEDTVQLSVNKPKKEFPKWVIGIIAAVAVAVCIAAFVPKKAKKETLDLTGSLEFTYEGYNGQGTAAPSGDYHESEWYKNLDEKANQYVTDTIDGVLSDKDKKEANNVIAASLALDRYPLITDENGDEIDLYNLSNGQKFTVTYDFTDDELQSIEAIGYEVTGLSKTFEVSGLTDQETIDLFKDVSLTYRQDGESFVPVLNTDGIKLPNGSIVGMRMSQNNDGTYTVTALTSVIELQQMGYVAKNDALTKTFTADECGIKKLTVNNMTDVDKEALKNRGLEVLTGMMNNQCGNTITNTVSGASGSVTSITYYGMTDLSSYTDYDYDMGLVYKIDSSNGETVYFELGFDAWKKTGSGEYVYFGELNEAPVTHCHYDVKSALGDHIVDADQLTNIYYLNW